MMGARSDNFMLAIAELFDDTLQIPRMGRIMNECKAHSIKGCNHCLSTAAKRADKLDEEQSENKPPHGDLGNDPVLALKKELGASLAGGIFGDEPPIMQNFLQRVAERIYEAESKVEKLTKQNEKMTKTLNDPDLMWKRIEKLNKGE